MHVFFITQWFPTEQHPYNGIFILEHARAVTRLHDISLLHIQGVDNTIDRAIQITSQQFQPRLMVYHLSYRRPTLPYTAWIRQILGARQVFWMASNNYGKPDVIHGNVNNTASLSVVLGRLANVPTVLSEHSSSYARKLFKSSQLRIIRFFMNRINVILPVCEALGQEIRNYGITSPMLIVPNGVDTDIFYPAAPGEQVSRPQREITIVARLDKEKAVHLAIQAQAGLQKQGISIYLQIIGDGPERANLEALVDDLDLTNWVHLHGNLPKNELANILRHSSAFLLSSIWENLPAAILEALACGLPVVAPAVGGIPEVITPACGLLFKPGDIEDLTSKLSTLLGNLSSYDTRAIHQYAMDNFSAQVVGNTFDRIYRQLIENRHAFD